MKFWQKYKKLISLITGVVGLLFLIGGFFFLVVSFNQLSKTEMNMQSYTQVYSKYVRALDNPNIENASLEFINANDAAIGFMSNENTGNNNQVANQMEEFINSTNVQEFQGVQSNTPKTRELRQELLNTINNNQAAIQKINIGNDYFSGIMTFIVIGGILLAISIILLIAFKNNKLIENIEIED